MTCIIWIKHKWKVYMWWDEAGVCGLNVTMRKDPKVFVNWEYLIWCTSSFRMIQVLMFAKLPKYNKKIPLFEFMVTKFIPEIKKIFLEERKGDKTQDGQWWNFLVWFQWELFEIQNDFQVVMVKNFVFNSVWCWEEYAKGMLFARYHESRDPVEIIENTIKNVSEFSWWVKWVWKVLLV